jgi:protein TonB
MNNFMKTYLITAFLFLFIVAAKAQTTPPPAPPTPPDADSVSKKTDSTEYIKVERAPEFPGGVNKFMLFVKKSLRLPAIAEDITGKEIVSFFIEKDGNVTEVKVTSGLSADIDKEIVRVISLSPKWRPGIQNGKQVRVAYSIVIPIPIPPYL